MRSIQKIMATVLLLTPAMAAAEADEQTYQREISENALTEAYWSHPNYPNYRTVSESEAERLNSMLRQHPSVASKTNRPSGSAEGWTFRFDPQPSNSELNDFYVEQINRQLSEYPTAAGNRIANYNYPLGTAEGWTFRFNSDRY